MRILKRFCIVVLLASILIWILPYLYTPPALDKQKVSVYSKVNVLMKNHAEWGRDVVLDYPLIQLDGHSFFVDIDEDKKRLHHLLTPKDIQQIKEISSLTESVHCDRVEIESNMLMFYTDWNLILPPPAGVLYSLKGENPNIAGGETVTKMRPYYRITGKWYASRKLINRLNRGPQAPVPKSLVDLTLSTHWLDNK